MDSAGIPWYSTGTVNVTQGSTNITGVGTNWVNAGLKKGDIFTLDKSRLYQVWTVNSNTSITLQEAYQGATGTAQTYFVIRNFAATMQAEIAAQVAELVNKYESYIDTELKQITGPAGPTSFPYRGTWATGRTYNGLDVVQYGNQLYMALYGHTSTSANAPGATGTAWTQLTFDAAFSAVKAELAALANAGAKNLLPSDGADSVTISGITWTKNADGSVTANGTATETSVYTVKTPFTIPKGTWTLTGCPANGSSSTYFISIWNSSGGNEYRDVGNGVTKTLTENYTYDSGIRLVVYNGTTVNNLTFYPMLRDASITDDTYVPYGKTNAEITAELGCNYTKTLSGDYMDFQIYRYGNVVQVSYISALKQQIPVGSGSANETLLGTLPVGYRPVNNYGGVFANNTATKNFLVLITSDGSIRVRTPQVLQNETLVISAMFLAVPTSEIRN